MSTLIRRDNKWSQVAGGTRLWTGTRAQLDKELAAGTLPDYTQVMVTDDYEENCCVEADSGQSAGSSYNSGVTDFKDKLQNYLTSNVQMSDVTVTHAVWLRDGNTVTVFLSFTYNGSNTVDYNVTQDKGDEYVTQLGLPHVQQVNDTAMPVLFTCSVQPSAITTLNDWVKMSTVSLLWMGKNANGNTCHLRLPDVSGTYMFYSTYITDSFALDDAVVTPDVNSDEIPSNAVTNQLSTIATCDSQYNISGLYWYTVDSHKNVTLLVRNAGVSTDSSKENIYIEKGKIPVPANPTSVQGVQLIDEATHEVNGNVWFDSDCKLNIRQDNNGNTFRFLLQYRSV